MLLREDTSSIRGSKAMFDESVALEVRAVVYALGKASSLFPRGYEAVDDHDGMGEYKNLRDNGSVGITIFRVFEQHPRWLLFKILRVLG